MAVRRSGRRAKFQNTYPGNFRRRLRVGRERRREKDEGDEKPSEGSH
jgi:hypothetical protein